LPKRKVLSDMAGVRVEVTMRGGGAGGGEVRARVRGTEGRKDRCIH
jgi:hypothetical protein